MRIQTLKNLQYFTIILIFLAFYEVCEGENSIPMKNLKLYQVSKRNLISKELEYLKSKPLSKELRSFISRHKRRSGSLPSKREKGLDKDHMYVVKDGDIIPFEDIESGQTDAEIIRPNGEHDDRFTVIPLIIPITVSKERERSVDPCEEVDTTSKETTTLQEPTKRTRRQSVTTTESTSSENDEESTTTGQTMNPKLLNRVFADIKELISDHEIPKESTVCDVFGDWDSTAGGMQIRITVQNDTKHPEVRLVEREPPSDEGIFKDGNWSISALVPYTKASILMLNAHRLRKRKIVAVFVGECRICEQEETIAGTWLIQRQSKDCSDRGVSHKFVSDVLKKNNIRRLQQQHLNAIVTVPSITIV